MLGCMQCSFMGLYFSMVREKLSPVKSSSKQPTQSTIRPSKSSFGNLNALLKSRLGGLACPNAHRQSDIEHLYGALDHVT